MQENGLAGQGDGYGNETESSVPAYMSIYELYFSILKARGPQRVDSPEMVEIYSAVPEIKQSVRNMCG